MTLPVLLLLASMVAQATAAPSAGDAAMRRGDFYGAFAAYTAAAGANPADPAAALGLGTVDLYRNDLAGARTYLSKAAQLDPANPRVKARLHTLEGREPNAQDFQISMSSGEVDVPFLTIDPLPILHARINGADAELFVDTGASTIVLTPAATERLKIPTHVAGQGVFAGGKTGEARAGRVDSFSVPGLTVRGIPADIAPGAMDLDGRRLDGAIGTGLLYRFLATIDYPHRKLVLRPRSASDGFEAAAAQRGAASVPMWLVGDHFIFARAQVNDAPEALFNIDTGGGGLGIQLTKASLEAAHITPQPAKADQFRGGGGDARVFPFTAPVVSLGTYRRTNVPGLYFPDGDQFGIFPFEVAGTLSDLFLRSAAVTFDFTAMKMVLGNA